MGTIPFVAQAILRAPLVRSRGSSISTGDSSVVASSIGSASGGFATSTAHPAASQRTISP